MVQKYIVASEDIAAGTTLTEAVLAYKRSGKTGQENGGKHRPLLPREVNQVTGKRLAVDVHRDDHITLSKLLGDLAFNELSGTPAGLQGPSCRVAADWLRWQ